MDEKRFSDTVERLRGRIRRFRRGVRDPWAEDQPSHIDPDVVRLIEKLRRIKRA